MVQGKRIVILGGSAGIGLAVAKAAAREGAEVIIASRNPERVERALGELRQAAPKATVQGHALDTRAQPPRAFFDEVGSFDHLVYTAGEELLTKPLAEMDLAAARAFFEVRYWGALTAIQAALPHLAKTGSIVLSSGTAGRRPFPGFTLVSGVCGAMESTMRSLAVELAPIRVNVVTPGLVDTELWAGLAEEARQGLFQMGKKLPVGRIGTPDDIAEHYLSFMRGGYVTGQTIVVDGGGVLV